MNIELKIDEKCKDNKIIIQANKMTKEIENVFELLKQVNESKFLVTLNEETFFITENDIESIYSMDKKVFIKTEDNTYQTKQRLYEFENILPSNDFIRISNSEIVNLNKVKSINTRILGSIVITFFSGYKTYSSRRYIARIKEVLGI